MYHAKKLGADQFQFYLKKINEGYLPGLELESSSGPQK